jgi:hypothetical protein
MGGRVRGWAEYYDRVQRTILSVGSPERGVGARQPIAATDEMHRPKRLSDRNRRIHNASFHHAGYLALRMAGSKGVQGMPPRRLLREYGSAAAIAV